MPFNYYKNHRVMQRIILLYFLSSCFPTFLGQSGDVVSYRSALYVLCLETLQSVSHPPVKCIFVWYLE